MLLAASVFSGSGFINLARMPESGVFLCTGLFGVALRVTLCILSRPFGGFIRIEVAGQWGCCSWRGSKLLRVH